MPAFAGNAKVLPCLPLHLLASETMAGFAGQAAFLPCLPLHLLPSETMASFAGHAAVLPCLPLQLLASETMAAVPGQLALLGGFAIAIGWLRDRDGFAACFVLPCRVVSRLASRSRSA